MAAVECVDTSDDAVALADVDAGQVDAVLEGSLLDVIDAGGQVDGGKPVAVVDGCEADVLDAGADGDAAELLAAAEGVVADAGDVVADGDAGQCLPAPGGGGAPKIIDGGLLVVIHFSRSADGQSGVVAATVLGEGPRGVVTARAADGLQRGRDGDVAGAHGEAGRALVGSEGGGGSRGGEGDESLVGASGDGHRGVLCVVAAATVGVAGGWADGGSVGDAADDADRHGAVGVGSAYAEAGGAGDAVHLAVVIAADGGGAGAAAVIVLAADGSVAVAVGTAGDGGHVGSLCQTAVDFAVVAAYDAAEAVLGGIAALAEGGGADAVAHGRGLAGAARYAAEVLSSVLVIGIDIDAVGGGTARKFAVTEVAHNAANLSATSEDGIAHGEVVDVGFAGGSEDAYVGIAVAIAAPIDADAADGLAVAVEVALECVVIIAITDGRVVAGRGRAAAVVEGLFETEVRLRVGRTVVHVRCQLIEVGVAGDEERVAAGAAALPCPCRHSREHHCGQRHRRPPQK